MILCRNRCRYLLIYRQVDVRWKKKICKIYITQLQIPNSGVYKYISCVYMYILSNQG